MKNKIIRIESIDDIDTSKISVYDLNNRYIDSKGNMYGLKYNRMLKKIDIIKIIRTHADDASVFHQKIIQKKIIETRSEGDLNGSESEFDDNEFEEEEEYFEPNSFIMHSLDLMISHRERLKGIMMNIKKSNLYPKENKADSIELENIFRNIDIDGIQQFEKVENYQKELANYPRSITYYQAKIDTSGRNMIEMLAGDNEKIMKFIYQYEMYNAILSLYRNMKKIFNTLVEFLRHSDDENIKNLPQNEKQSYNDAMVSIDNTQNEIDDLLDSIIPLEEHLKNPDNF